MSHTWPDVLSTLVAGRDLTTEQARWAMDEVFAGAATPVQIAAFVVALRVSAPFIIYSVVVNLAVGLTNKMTPQIPVFFLATPFIMLGGLLLMYFLVSDFMLLFMDSFSTWLRNG